MKSQQLCLMPAACAKCEKLFDISDDFRKEEEITERELLRTDKATLCWDCRLEDKRKKRR